MLVDTATGENDSPRTFRRSSSSLQMFTRAQQTDVQSIDLDEESLFQSESQPNDEERRNDGFDDDVEFSSNRSPLDFSRTRQRKRVD